MQSTRLNKEGKLITSPSLVPASHVDWPYTGHYSDPICGIDDESIYEAWRKRTYGDGNTHLSRTTSLGKNVSVIGGGREQNDLSRFLVQHNRWLEQDFVTFRNYLVDSTVVTANTVYYIMDIQRDINKVNWPEREDSPKPFLLLSLSQAGSNMWPATARWSNLLYHRHTTHGEHTSIVKHNVQLQDYIQQARESYKAGALSIEG